MSHGLIGRHERPAPILTVRNWEDPDLRPGRLAVHDRTPSGPSSVA